MANSEETAVREEIERILKTRDRDEWHELLAAANVCVGKVYDTEEMILDPQIGHRQLITEASHPKYAKIRQFGPTIKLSATPAQVRLKYVMPRRFLREIPVCWMMGQAAGTAAGMAIAAGVRVRDVDVKQVRS